MIKNILHELMLECNFKMISHDDNISTFSRVDGESRRFITMLFVDELSSVEETHSQVMEKIPEEMMLDPAFHKNTDLIIAVKFHMLDDFRPVEEKILSLEEDAHYFKKYVLYYTDVEEDILNGKTFSDLTNVILNKEQFRKYKDDAALLGLYGIAARIFIKLPFLELPVSQNQLVPLTKQAPELLSRLGLTDLNRLIASTSDDDIDDVINGLINDEMENIQDKD